MKKTFARFLSFLLVVAMLMPSALASDIIAPGSGGTSPGSGGGGTGTKWSSPTNLGPGMLLHVQSTGQQVTFDYTDPANVVSKGYDKVVGYWTSYFPNTDPDSGQTGIYLLPTWVKSNYDQSAIQFKPNGSLTYSYDPVSYIKMGSTNGKIINQLGKSAYAKAAESLTNESNPNYTLPANYWQSLVSNGSTQSQCSSIVTQLFSANNPSFGYSDGDTDAITNRVMYYLGESAGDNDWSEFYTDNEKRSVGKFMNYCGLLATVIATLPAAERDARAKELDRMCQDFLGGQGYTPMVVTGEIVVPTEYNNDTSWSVWWTPQQALRAVTGISWADDIKTNRIDVTKDVIDQIGRRSGKAGNGATTMYGVPSYNGWKAYSDSSVTLPILGNVISSVSQSIIDHYEVSGKPIRGFGVWGLSSTPPAPPIPKPPTPVQITAMGDVGVLVEEKKYQKDVGAYSQTFNVTVTVSLGADYAVGEDDSLASERSMDQEGAGIANTLRWIQARRNEGQNIPDPSISIWLAQAEAIKALDGDDSSYLIEETLGYFGDGNELTPNYDGRQVSSNQIESSLGAGFTWTLVDSSKLAFKDGNIPGMTVGPGEGNSLQITFTDLNKCADYFATHDDTLVFIGEYAGNGTLDDESAKNQHWFKVGARVQYYGPSSLEDMNTATQVNVGLHSNPKYDYSTITAMPEEDPFYYSKYQRPYSELKQGTVPTSGGGSDEKFNSMTGTPTFTDTSNRTDFAGTPYENAGRYYQYFASGGSEFVVQFDGKYHYNESATRNFTFNFSGVNCDQSTGSYQCPGHPTEDGGMTYCDDSCVHAVHCSKHPHVLSSSCSFSVTYNGLSYVEITNLKVWKLSEARLDGTRELLDTDEVFAEVKSTAPGISYNIAASNTAEQGRMVYEWMPKGTGEGGDRDNLVWNRTSSSSCSGAAEENKAVVEGILSGATAGAVMLSDYIVLHTTNGDQAILYFETESDSTGVPIMSSITTSSHSPTFGSDNATITVTVTPSVADGVEFPELKNKDTEALQNLLWKNNSYTSEGCSLPEDGITYGGYNGNYSSMNTKYKSSGHPANMTNWSSTTAYKNISGVFGQKSNSELYKATVTKKLRLLNDELVIPDYKQNGEYIVGESSIFYENIVNFGTEQPNYPIVTQDDFGGRKGFVVKTTYSPSHDKINDIVVYNPVSNQNAIVVSLPKDRDQRVSTHITAQVDKSVQCPGDASCPYLKNVCTVTEHIHTEACYQQLEYEVHGPNNVHVHDENCGGGSDTIRKSVSYSASGTDVYSFTATGSGTVRFYSTSYNKDPRGRIYVNGSLVVNDDDGGSNLNFDTGEVRISKGDSVRLNVCQYGSTGSGRCDIVIEIEYDGGGWYVTHRSGCTYAGETHFTTSKSECTTCGHSCGGTYTSAYTCNNLPLNAHQCNANQDGGQNQQQHETISRRVSYSASGTDVHSFTAWDSGTVRFRSTWNDNDPRGRVYVNGSQRVDNDDGAGSLNFDTGAVRFDKGDNIRLNVYQFGSRGDGNCDIVIEINYDNPPVVIPTVKCYTMNKSVLSCSDPHHAYSYNWRIYTYGLKHTSGEICSGRSCTDTTDLVFPTQEEYSLAECAAGFIVRHSNGDVHLSTSQGVCTYCGQTYKELLSSAQDTDRTPDPSEYECYTYGDTRCWAPCNNPENHNKYTTEITDNGTTYQMGDFINLDWPFTIYFPNTGDFYGTGAEWSSTTSPERGHGYTDGMDATEWTKCKWVEFPFAVVYEGQTFLAYERIYLEVPKTVFEFYVPLHDFEIANAEVKFGSVAINTQNGEELECGANENHNISNITYAGKPMAHHHNADKRTYIDVVGRIGNLALNDTGDFRYSNLFKQSLSEWLVQNIVKKVDPTKQNYIMLDGVDVRKVPITSTGVAGNTHNTRPERGNINKILNFPLTPAKNNITALQRQPIRVGYDSYFDLTTLGNYYGNAITNEDGSVESQNLVLIKPHYYRLDLDTGEYKPVDVYMDVNGNYVLINDNDSNTVAYNGADANVNLNWVEEKDRRNYSGSEVTNSNLVADANSWVELPTGSSWVYGNYNILNLTQRNRTFVGSEYTYNDKDDWNSHKDPSDRLPNTLAALQGQRWHFNVGLPSSAVFVYSGQEASKANIEACSSGNAVIFCALEIYAQGEVWTLAYDGSNVNVPFTVTPGGKTYDPYVPYPDPDKNPKGEEMPIVSIISINHSSKEDMDVIGTQ